MCKSMICTRVVSSAMKKCIYMCLSCVLYICEYVYARVRVLALCHSTPTCNLPHSRIQSPSLTHSLATREVLLDQLAELL